MKFIDAPQFHRHKQNQIGDFLGCLSLVYITLSGSGERFISRETLE